MEIPTAAMAAASFAVLPVSHKVFALIMSFMNAPLVRVLRRR
jgi:hypothetical protein